MFYLKYYLIITNYVSNTTYLTPQSSYIGCNIKIFNDYFTDYKITTFTENSLKWK